MPTFGSLFAGIGGIDLGLERAGWTGRWQVEWDEYCQHVLAHHWPDVPRVGDIHDAHARAICPLGNATEQAGRDLGSTAGQSRSIDPGETGCNSCLEPVDLIAGGFPCQPFSVAGKQRRLDDDRWLWPEFARVIRELRPRYVLVENVPGLLAGAGMGDVLGDLAELGYDAEWESIPAAAVGAPHLRYRVWIVASHTDRKGQPGQPVHADARSGFVVQDADSSSVEPRRGRRGTPEAGELADSDLIDAQGFLPSVPDEEVWSGPIERPAGSRRDGNGWWSVEPDVGRVAHGVPARVDRLRALGNAVVPQVVEVIGRRLIEVIERAA